MKFRMLVLLVAAAVLSACGKDDSLPTGTGSVRLAPYVGDYVWFDTSSVLYVQSSFDVMGERYVDGDGIIGEPFVDVNGDGIYDPAVDSFIISSDSTNQDWNHNGRRDGPNDLYTVGTHFDDFNGDGVYSNPDHMYSAGEPFFDVNGNGVWDTRDAWVVMQGRFTSDSTGDSYGWYYRDSVAVWVSDSGMVYAFPSRKDVWDSHAQDYRRNPLLNIRLKADSVIFHDVGTWVQWDVPLLESPNDVWRAVRVTLVKYGADSSRYSMRRTTQYGASLEINSVTYHDLVRIRLDSLVMNDTLSLSDYYYDFYFSKEQGFLAGFWYSYGLANSPRFVENVGRCDSLPLPLTREPLER